MSAEFLFYYQITRLRSYNTVWFIVSEFNALLIKISGLSFSINRTNQFDDLRLRNPLNGPRRCLLIYLLIFLWIVPYPLYFLFFQPVKIFKNYIDYLRFVVRRFSLKFRYTPYTRYIFSITYSYLNLGREFPSPQCR